MEVNKIYNENNLTTICTACGHDAHERKCEQWVDAAPRRWAKRCNCAPIAPPETPDAAGDAMEKVREEKQEIDMKRETFWMIEKKVNGCPVWLSNDPQFGWTPNGMTAFQYKTEAEALAVMRELPDAEDWFVTSHSMIGAEASWGVEDEPCPHCKMAPATPIGWIRWTPRGSK